MEWNGFWHFYSNNHDTLLGKLISFFSGFINTYYIHKVIIPICVFVLCIVAIWVFAKRRKWLKTTIVLLVAAMCYLFAYLGDFYCQMGAECWLCTRDPYSYFDYNPDTAEKTWNGACYYAYIDKPTFTRIFFANALHNDVWWYFHQHEDEIRQWEHWVVLDKKLFPTQEEE